MITMDSTTTKKAEVSHNEVGKSLMPEAEFVFSPLAAIRALCDRRTDVLSVEEARRYAQPFGIEPEVLEFSPGSVTINGKPTAEAVIGVSVLNLAEAIARRCRVKFSYWHERRTRNGVIRTFQLNNTKKRNIVRKAVEDLLKSNGGIVPLDDSSDFGHSQHTEMQKSI